MNYWLLIPFFALFSLELSAQVCGFSEGKNLATLRAAVYDKTSPSHARSFLPEIGVQIPLKKQATLPPLFLLPKWSAETLPFFCKIEHSWGKNSSLPVKFRLGSVEYVDWLEGK